MTLYFSAAANGFYDDAISAVLPDDCVEITAETHAALMEAQAAGQVIAAAEDGTPQAVDRTVTLAEAQAAQTAILSAACATEINAGFSSDVTGETLTFTLSLEDQANMDSAYALALRAQTEATAWTAGETVGVNAVRLGSNDETIIYTASGTCGDAEPSWPTEFQVAVTDGTATAALAGYLIDTSAGTVWVTPDEAISLYLMAKDHIVTCRAKYRALAAAVAAASTTDEVAAIAW